VARAWNRRSITCEFGEGNAESAWHRITEIGMLRKGVAKGGSSAIAPARGRAASKSTRATKEKPTAVASPETDGDEA
jgi:hypothetical protein